ncbi:Bgt-50357 [Blumeria graminis f. sp. tritici]|uniref:Bgt-50357 n=1 Tax=Blumeria graminis f. sp. tritici TaxID=62690 RepID=A0A9X9LAI1_BLUGR|nr:Bgt-50357 [Blumeria graminis f. sp. tritici]
MKTRREWAEAHIDWTYEDWTSISWTDKTWVEDGRTECDGLCPDWDWSLGPLRLQGKVVAKQRSWIDERGL